MNWLTFLTIVLQVLLSAVVLFVLSAMASAMYDAIRGKKR